MKRHISGDIQGILRNFKGRSMNGIFSDEDNIPLTDSEARGLLQEALDAGEKYIPSANCDNFDPQKGCLGHEE